MSDPIPVEIVNDAPTVLDWLTAIGTVGAVIVALGIGVAEYLRGSSDRREQRADRRRAQAALVNAWLQVEIEFNGGADVRMLAAYRVQNASGAPVYDLVVHHPAGFWGPSASLSRYGVLVPTNGARLLGDPEEVRFDDDSDVQLEHTFRDASGLWWRRGTDGVLEELSGDPHAEA